MLRPIRFLRANPAWAGASVAAIVALGIFVFVYFQPHKLFVDERVQETIPSAEPTPVGTEGADAQPTTLTAVFRSLEHETTGRAIVTEGADGSRVLSFAGFKTSNGPDLRVYLSAGDNDASFGKQYGENFVELGKLKGNIGDQNYTIPAATDLRKYRNAVIWCKRFSVGFGVATFQA